MATRAEAAFDPACDSNDKSTGLDPGAAAGPGQSQPDTAALLRASRAVLEHRGFEEATRAIFDAAKTLIGATSGYIALLDTDGKHNEVLFLDSGGLPCNVDPSLPMPIRGLREEAYRAGKVVYDNDFAASPSIQFMPEGHAELHSVLFAPLVLDGKVWGLMGLANKPGGFTENDARWAKGFAEFAAIALRNSKTLEALEHSEQRFRTLAETATDAIICMNSDGAVVLWNDAAEEMFGYAAAEVLGKSIARIIPKQFRAAHQQAVRRVVEHGELKLIGKTTELTALRSDGSEFPIELSLASWQTTEGMFFTGIIRDVAQRKRAEEQIAKLAKFPAENPNPVLRVAGDGTVLYGNRASAPLLHAWQCREGETLSGDWHRLIREALGTGHSGQAELACDHRVFSLTFAPVPESDYVNVYALDITQRKQAEAELRTAHEGLERRVEERTAELIEANRQLRQEMEDRELAEEALRVSQARLKNAQRVARLGVWDWNTVTNELYWSDEIYRIFGLSPQEFKATYDAFLSSVHPDDRQLVQKRVEAALQDDLEYSVDHRIVLPSGQVRHVHEQGEVTRDARGAPLRMVGTVSDITERVELERSLADLTVQEQRRIGQELHDGVGQELTGLSYFAKSLEKRLQAQESPETKTAAELSQGLQHALGQVHAAARNLVPSDVDADMLEPALRALAASVQERYGIECHFRSNRAVRLAHDNTAVHLYRIAQESVNNAVKHGGAQHVVIELSSHNKRITLEVHDDGTGFCDDSGKGSGMGLRIMQYRANVIGGTFDVRASNGGGTIATCSCQED